MDKRSFIVIHYNPSLYNQRLYASYLNDGFDRLGHDVLCTPDRDKVGDINVCIGPHYALRNCLNRNTIYIDRCLWGDDLDAVSIGWIDERGGMKYPAGSPGDRDKPELLEWVDEKADKAIFLCDWGPYPLGHYGEAKKAYGWVTLRPHPATKKVQPELIDHLKGHKVVIGYRTSALVTAAIHGYPVICLDDRAPVAPIAGHDILEIRRPDRTQWLNDLSYAQWRGEEIKSGEALEYVLNNHSAANSRAAKS